MEQDIPFQVVHKLCGEPIFYYFGDYEEAKVLKNFDNITTLDGDAITPDDIRACKNCGVKINLSQIEVAMHMPTHTDPYEVKQDEGEDTSKGPVFINNEPKIETDGTDFWVNPNDPNRVRK